YADVEDIVQGSMPEGGDARYLAALDIASRRLAEGELSRARQALDLTEELPGRDGRRFVLRALLDQCEGRLGRALRWARIACRADPYSSQALCALAGIRMQRGDKARAFAALMRAAPLCLYPGERQAVAAAALGMGLPNAACALAAASCRLTPDRLAAHFDRAVVLMYAGLPDQARAAVALCRALDPGDVPSQCLEHYLSGLSTPAQTRAAALRQPFYPGAAPTEAQDRLLRLAEPLQKGLEPFCQLLQEDGALYETFLYALTLSGAGLGRLLGLVATSLPADFAERLLRETLTLETSEDDVKRTAAAALVAIGAQPPFVVRHGGRVAQLDPRVRQSPGVSMEKQMLEKRMLDLWNSTHDSRLLTHALRLMTRMNGRELEAVAADAPLIFRTALEEHYARAYHLPESDRLRRLRARTAGSKRKVRLAYVKFCRLVPLEEEKKHGNH
ncbi:MAG: hypothetical protein PHY12_14480, partial [Eubacteriales bacterium]|nr:hypothetical protein [Eubacteriales bacterium]